MLVPSHRTGYLSHPIMTTLPPYLPSSDLAITLPLVLPTVAVGIPARRRWRAGLPPQQHYKPVYACDILEHIRVTGGRAGTGRQRFAPARGACMPGWAGTVGDMVWR